MRNSSWDALHKVLISIHSKQLSLISVTRITRLCTSIFWTPFQACTQGIITFGSTNTDGTSSALPASSVPVVAAFWESGNTVITQSNAVLFYRLGRKVLGFRVSGCRNSFFCFEKFYSVLHVMLKIQQTYY